MKSNQLKNLITFKIIIKKILRKSKILITQMINKAKIAIDLKNIMIL